MRQTNSKPPTETKISSAPKPGDPPTRQIHIPVIIPQRSPPVTTRQRQPTTRRQASGPNPPDGPLQPVLDGGEAGPPGTVRRTFLKLPQSDGAMTPFTGYAGAPGENRDIT